MNIQRREWGMFAFSLIIGLWCAVLVADKETLEDELRTQGAYLADVELMVRLDRSRVGFLSDALDFLDTLGFGDTSKTRWQTVRSEVLDDSSWAVHLGYVFPAPNGREKQK